MIYYTQGKPTETGVYAVRVEDPLMGLPWKEDKFLMWHEGKWWHLRSTQSYRGEVLGFAGPLSRSMEPKPRYIRR